MEELRVYTTKQGRVTIETVAGDFICDMSWNDGEQGIEAIDEQEAIAAEIVKRCNFITRKPIPEPQPRWPINIKTEGRME